MSIRTEFVQDFPLKNIIHDVFRVGVLVDHATQEGLEVCSTRHDIHVRGIPEILLNVRQVRSCACKDSSTGAATKVVQNPKQA